VNIFAEQHRRAQKRDIDSQRMTGGQLFEKFMERARDNGDAARFAEIGDYVLSESLERANCAAMSSICSPS
jgi:hypothetical protein